MSGKPLYDEDVLSWSQQQSTALRALSRQPGLSNAVDWDNVIEEVESVGRSELSAVESQLRNALVHILKGVCDPDALSVRAWDAETDVFLTSARRGFTASMRQRLDIERLWKEAFRDAHKALAAYRIIFPPGVPKACPFTLDDMLQETFEFDAARRHIFSMMASS